MNNKIDHTHKVHAVLMNIKNASKTGPAMHGLTGRTECYGPDTHTHTHTHTRTHTHTHNAHTHTHKLTFLRRVAYIKIVVRFLCTNDVHFMRETLWFTTTSPLQLNGARRESSTTLKLLNINLGDL